MDALVYLGYNKLIPNSQSAYRKHRSTETATLKVMSDVYEAMDAGKITLVSLLDLIAAFYIVNLSFLLQRLHSSFGISDNVLLRLESYLTGRTQYVRFNGAVHPRQWCSVEYNKDQCWVQFSSFCTVQASSI